MRLKGKDVVVGVTGGIAAYKACELVSRLVKEGASVYVVMTANATRFVAPLTFETLSNHPVVTDTFDRPQTWEVEHIALAKRAALFCVAPATANILAKMAHGIADDMLSTTLLATKAPVLVAPAMNTGMWTAPVTQENLRLLKARGVHQVGPDAGRLACGDAGAGRMAEPAQILEEIVNILSKPRDLEGKKVLVTAGPTRERLDPVRYMTNDSSGKMGYAIAQAARERGAEVTLVTGPVALTPPDEATVKRIESTCQLYDAVTALAPEQDLVIQAAAPADYRFSHTSDQKMKKQGGAGLTLTLVENPDIAAAIGKNKKPGQIFVGFAAETENLIENAKSKLDKKNLDLVVANDVTQPGAGFNVDTNIAALITHERVLELPLQSKRALADRILTEAALLWNK
ncbi:MAG: bifunctional phosphopantothenoylcysteine decarboxylase/phosphopantothenate--cysteine ligase CoaBC [Clostridia bacterium]|nr:bifunctional phosphopantothenoylcysteine decarboxylase/phosphopantothenate--cysteine ligase CoaBC [Clostridia bacterium]